MLQINFPFFDKLVTILNNQLISLNRIEVESLYAKWSDGFSNDLNILSDIISKMSVHENQNIPRNSILNGIDLPTWFGDFQNKKIIFLGIDPLRNNKDFQKLDANIKQDVIVGTPYAFHIKSLRENRTSPYWQVISVVANSNFVYFTDIYKTFFYTDNTKKIRSYEFWNKDANSNLNQNHRRLLVD